VWALPSVRDDLPRTPQQGAACETDLIDPTNAEGS
jgi:hypothetical protein